MRITHNILITNFLRNLNNIALRLERTQQQLATGVKFQRPAHGPVEVGQIIGFKSSLAKIGQFTKNVDDGSSQVGYLDTIIQSTVGYTGQARDLIVDGANDNLNINDRRSIAQEIELILASTLSDANSRFRDRYMFGGWRTRTIPFEAVYNPRTKFLDDIIYSGNRGHIDRLIGDTERLSINVTGKDLFLRQTYTRKGSVLPPEKELGFTGTLTLNGVDFDINAEDTLTDIQLMIEARVDKAHVFASIDSGRLVLESAYAVKEFTISDNQDNRLVEDLGLHVSGAFNHAYQAPTLPLTDSTPAIFTGAGPVANLIYDNTNNTLNIFLGADANGGISQAKNIIITPGTYASVADLIIELQTRIDEAFGSQKIIVSDAGGGVLQLETVTTGAAVDGGDLVIGGPFNGLDDTAADDADLNLIAFTGNAPATFAGTVGTDGDDKIIIDLGPTTSKTGEDVLPQTIDLRASVITDIFTLADEINYQIFQNDTLRGVVSVRIEDGRLFFETANQGIDIPAADFQITEGAAGTLLALGISDVQTQAYYTGINLAFPYVIVPGVTDTMTIDLGPSVSNEGTNPDPVTLTIPAGVYANINALAAEIALQIQINPELNGAVQLVINGNALDLYSVKTGSSVRGIDLVASGGLATAIGWSASQAVNGGGTSDGRGDVMEPQNIFHSMITMRNDLNGTISTYTKVLNAQNEDQHLFDLFEGDVVTVTYDAGTFTFTLLATDTFDDFVNNIQAILGTRAEVSVTTDGRIEIENLETTQILNLDISVASAIGQPRTLFNDIFDELPGTVPGLISVVSGKMIDPQKYLRLGNEDLVLADLDLENLLRHIAIVGARANRLNILIDQLSASDMNIEGLKVSIEAANYAEILTSLSQQEAVFQSALMVGSSVLTPSLLDYLR
jgi:flagellin-like hook-associated protein FlgL